MRKRNSENHHWIQRSYLKRWRNKGERNRVWVFHKNAQHAHYINPEPVSTSNICSSPDLYKIDQNNLIEKLMADIESNLGPSLKKAHNLETLDQEDEFNIKAFFALIHARHPNMKIRSEVIIQFSASPVLQNNPHAQTFRTSMKHIWPTYNNTHLQIRYIRNEIYPEYSFITSCGPHIHFPVNGNLKAWSLESPNTGFS